MIVVPLIGGAAYAHQTFSMQLGDNLIDFKLDYITVAGPAWSLDASINGEPVISGAMLEPGVDIAKVYNAGIGKLVFVGEPVTLDNLGKSNKLVWVPA